MAGISVKNKIIKRVLDADREQINVAFAELKPFTDKRFKKWIDDSNCYKQDTVTQIKKINPINEPDLREYIAASGILHCYDGWKYMGAAIQAALSGDPDLARHSAYYAELRASMALLATQGIGIFNNRHYIVNATGQIKEFHKKTGTTHSASWDLLRIWSEEKSIDATSFFKLHGASLGEWIDEYSNLTHTMTMSSKTLFIQDWVKDWGVDLANLCSDRDSRNESSYRPTELNPRGLAKTKDVLSVVDEIWNLSRPQSSSSSFHTLDMYLVKRALQKLHIRNGYDLQTVNGKKIYRNNIDKIIENRFGERSHEVTRQYLRNTKLKNPIVINLAEKNKGKATADLCVSSHHLSVVSRAYLLLRMATGAVENQIAQSGQSADTLGFWWKKVGAIHCLWEPGDEPTNIKDLWADVQTPLEEVNISRDEYTSSYIFSEKQAQTNVGLHKLSQCHRIGLWGLLS